MIEVVKKLFSTKLVERFKKKSKLLGVKNKVSYESVLVLYFFVLMCSSLLSILKTAMLLLLTFMLPLLRTKYSPSFGSFPSSFPTLLHPASKANAIVAKSLILLFFIYQYLNWIVILNDLPLMG